MKCLVLCLLVTLAYSLPTTNVRTAPATTGTGNTRATDLLTEYLNFKTTQGRPFYYGDFDDDDFYKYLLFNRFTTGANTGIRTAPAAVRTAGTNTPVGTNFVAPAGQAHPQRYYIYYDD